MRRKIAGISGVFFVFAVLFSSTAAGQNFEKPRSKKLWIGSIVALVAANVLDTATSVGKFEANPLLRNSQGRFSTRGVGLKTAATGGMLCFQIVFARRNPEVMRVSSIVNYASAGLLAGTAIRNTRITSAQ